MLKETLCHIWYNHLTNCIELKIHSLFMKEPKAVPAEEGLDDRECLLNWVEVG